MRMRQKKDEGDAEMKKGRKDPGGRKGEGKRKSVRDEVR